MSSNEHPATKGFNTMWESVKHIGSKALKWAAYGAVALAVVSVITLVAPAAGLLGTVASWFGAGNAAGWTFSAMMPFLQFGATAGAVMGAAAGVGSLSGALEERKQDAIADYEQANVARQRAALMRGAGQGMGVASVAPSAGMGRGRGQGLEMG